MFRSVYDTIVSFYFHNSKHHQRYDKDIKSFIKDENLGINRWVNYVNSWSKILLKNKSHLIIYENLYNDTYETTKNILKFLNVELDDELLKKAIDMSTFDEMKKIEINKGIVDHNYNRENKDSRRVRSGKIGNYRKFLDSKDLIYIQDQINYNLNLNSKRLLTKIGLLPSSN